MTYTELAAAVASTTVNEFPAEDMARFARLTEQKIYNAVQFPALRKTSPLTITLGNPVVALPPDFLYPYALSVVTLDGEYRYLTPKDVSYIRAAYPSPLATGVPQCYAITDTANILVGPTPAAAYNAELNYGFMPESIVTAGTTWLGDNFDSVLLNGMLVEAARFMKEEPDVVALYTKMFDESMMQARQLGDGKMQSDTYRTPQARVPVN